MDFLACVRGAVGDNGAMKWPRMFGALSSRNYRLYFFGQMVSLVGTWMTSTASLWLVYHLSSSPFQLGLVGFASQAPMFFLAPFAGVWIDRVDRHRLLLVTQILSMLQSAALAGLTLSGHINVEWLVGLTFVQGMINGVDMPVRQALVVTFIERKEHLGNAIALNSSMFNLARLIGPAVAGFVIVGLGVGGCYVVDAISYVAVIVSLLAMRLAPQGQTRVPKHPLIELREGFAYAFGSKPIRAIMLTLAMISFAGFSYGVLAPMFARDVFGGDARTLGYLMSASAVGALLGATYLGSRTSIRGIGKVIALGGVLMGGGLIAFSLSHLFWLALLCVMTVGLGGVLVMASSNTALQTMVHEDKRGRIMSIYTMAFTGTTPMGNLVVGSVAHAWGATTALIGSGVICVLVAANFFRQLPGIRASATAPVQKSEPPECGSRS